MFYYQFLDFFYTLLHLFLIGFNMLGWIWKSTRKLHIIAVGMTAMSWFILGIWYGIGYCPVTDWQWSVKEKLGESNLPNSFIKYIADKISGRDVSDYAVDLATAISFGLVILIITFQNFIKKSSSRNERSKAV